MNSSDANRLSEKARKISKLASLGLEHPFTAHAAHEIAASAQEQVNEPKLAAEHRYAAQYWAKEELDRQWTPSTKFAMKWRSPPWLAWPVQKNM